MNNFTKTSLRVALMCSVGALAACKDDNVKPAMVFETVEDCTLEAAKPDAFFEAADCDAIFVKAQAEYQRTAPRYDSRELCEQEHGVGNCGGGGSYASSNNSSFMPFMMGYMMAGAFSGGGSNTTVNNYTTAPIVRDKTGSYRTTNGAQSFSKLNTTTKVTPMMMRAAPATVGKAPMTKATVAASGGFGARKTATGATTTTTKRVIAPSTRATTSTRTTTTRSFSPTKRSTSSRSFGSSRSFSSSR